MKYDFDRVVERRQTDSVKWDGVGGIFGREDILPMWVADMDFPVPQPVLEALAQRVEHGVFGYSMPGDSLKSAVVERMQRKYGWRVAPEWLVFAPGVVAALSVAVKAFTSPGDEAVIQTPVYYPFWDVIRNNGCQVECSPLYEEDGRYRMDYPDLRRRLTGRDGMIPIPARTRLLILSNPHNPVGRVWSREELRELGDIALAHNVMVLSDEIHAELLFSPNRHIPFASISEAFANRSITLMAPSKTFNLAGLSASVAIIPDAGMRKSYSSASAGFIGPTNTLGLVAFEAAYRHGDEWLGQLLEYLEGNLDFLMSYVSARIPEIRVIRPEGTYLVWLDCRKLGMDDQELRRFMRDEARVGLDDGFVFGPGGEGHQRMNIACPRVLLEEGLNRIERAVRAIRPIAL